MLGLTSVRRDSRRHSGFWIHARITAGLNCSAVKTGNLFEVANTLQVDNDTIKRYSGKNYMFKMNNTTSSHKLLLHSENNYECRTPFICVAENIEIGNFNENAYYCKKSAAHVTKLEL